MTKDIIKEFIEKMQKIGMLDIQLMGEDDTHYHFRMTRPLPEGGFSLVVLKEPKIAKGFTLKDYTPEYIAPEDLDV